MNAGYPVNTFVYLQKLVPDYLGRVSRGMAKNKKEKRVMGNEGHGQQQQQGKKAELKASQKTAGLKEDQGQQSGGGAKKG